MSLIPEVKCRRCGATFSSMRSRCPSCGTRRVNQSARTPAATPSTVKGTASYDRAETNTKWQLIFGLILVVAVILAVVVMVSTSLEGADVASTGTTITPPLVTEYVPVIEAAPTPEPTPPPAVENIRLLFFNTEIQTDFTMKEGESLDLTAQVMPLTLTDVSVDWTSSDTDCLVVTVTDAMNARVECISSAAGNVRLTLSCGNYSKEFTVYLAKP